MTYMTTGEMAAKFGVTARTLRFYDTIGLLHPKRRGQDRIFSETDQRTMSLIQHGKMLGLELAEIQDRISSDRTTLTIETDMALDLRLKAEYALLDAQSLTRKLQSLIPPTMIQPYRYVAEVAP